MPVPPPERNYSGSNNGRYINAELDALIDLPGNRAVERADGSGRSNLRHMTDQLAVMLLFYDMEVALVSDRVKNATPLLLPGGSPNVEPPRVGAAIVPVSPRCPPRGKGARRTASS